MAYNITTDGYGVLLNCSGIVTLLNVVDGLCCISGMEESETMDYIIINLKGVTNLKLNKKEFEKLYSIIKKIYKWNPRYKIIFLVTNKLDPDILNLEKNIGEPIFFYHLKDVRKMVYTEKVNCKANLN